MALLMMGLGLCALLFSGCSVADDQSMKEQKMESPMMHNDAGMQENMPMQDTMAAPEQNSMEQKDTMDKSMDNMHQSMSETMEKPMASDKKMMQ